LQGSSLFSHHQNINVSSFTVLIYNEDEDLVGGGAYTPSNQTNHAYTATNKFNDQYITQILVATSATFEQGQKGFAEYHAPSIGEQNVSLRFDYSVPYLTRRGG
ncbi:hypothetical protein PFISCL1PPCAC_25748, partial [Pristionchus fissidentatus]